jgi:hypothetical protein
MAGLEKSGRSAVVAARPWSTLHEEPVNKPEVIPPPPVKENRHDANTNTKKRPCDSNQWRVLDCLKDGVRSAKQQQPIDLLCRS